MPEFSVTPVLKGAGLYGEPAKSHVTKCVNSRNPHGHNRECPCGWYTAEVAERREAERLEAIRVATLRRLTLESREQDLRDQSAALSKKRTKGVTTEEAFDLIGEQMRINREYANSGV